MPARKPLPPMPLVLPVLSRPPEPPRVRRLDEAERKRIREVCAILGIETFDRDHMLRFLASSPKPYFLPISCIGNDTGLASDLLAALGVRRQEDGFEFGPYFV